MRATVSKALQPFGTTIFTTMTRLAQQHGAVNLSQGFPDFDGPTFIKQAAAEALMQQHNQYAPMPGLPALRQAIAQRFTRDTSLPCDPDTNVIVTSGCTEAIAAAIMGICDPGDDVVLFEPFYDSYRACVAMAGCTARFVALRPPTAVGERIGRGEIARAPFTFDPHELRRAITPKTKAILINTPHNPTGKVFSAEEMNLIADLCRTLDLVAICDEVYERLLLDGQQHINMAALPGMFERTITLSSLGKSFSLTGWKIGWTVAPAPLAAAIRSAHQFLTFSVATPLQHAAVVALARENECIAPLLTDLTARRNELAPVLARLGMRVFMPEGTYFIMAEHTALSRRMDATDDQDFCLKLIERAGVAAIPPSVFYDRKELGQPMARFAFCKKAETIGSAIARLMDFESKLPV